MNALPMLLRCGDSDPAVFCPSRHVNNLREFVRLSWAVKRPEGSEACGAREDMKVPDAPGSMVMTTDFGLRMDQQLWLPVEPGYSLALPGKSGLVINTVRCFHTVDSIGYVVCETRKSMQGVNEEAAAKYEALKLNAKKDKAAGKAIGEM